jgi:hypothetical protein
MHRGCLCLLCLATVLSAGQPSPQAPKPAPARSDPDDPGRPKLQRSGPATQRAPEVTPPAHPTESTKAATTPGAPASTGDDLIEKAREAAYLFDEQLPNFICDEYVLRWHSETRVPDWKLRDRVQLELLYVDRKEDYRNIKVNGRALKKGSPEDSGTWSTGEFGTVLRDIFADNTGASFKFRMSSTAAGLPAKVYDFRVAQPGAHWEVRFGRMVRPPYSGSLWIEPKSGRVLRIEMSSKQLPPDYELDTVEATVDYDWVTISGVKYLLPVKSENLGCFRGTFGCVKNEITFRAYRKFNVESQVLTTDSTISFPKEEPAADKKNKSPDQKKKQ